MELIPPQTDETIELAEREGRIERAQRNAYYEIGLELRAIRDRKLYRRFKTFEFYCEERWEWTPVRARQLIEAAEIAAKMETIVSILPSRESHVRPLLRLASDADRAAVWMRVLDDHPEGRGRQHGLQLAKFLLGRVL